MQHEWDMSDTSPKQVQHKDNTSATQVLHYMNDTSATRVNFDFDNYTSKNIFSHPYIYYMVSERLQGEDNLILRTTFWKYLVSMPKCVLKNWHHTNWTF